MQFREVTRHRVLARIEMLGDLSDKLEALAAGSTRYQQRLLQIRREVQDSNDLAESDVRNYFRKLHKFAEFGPVYCAYAIDKLTGDAKTSLDRAVLGLIKRHYNDGRPLDAETMKRDLVNTLRGV